ncbi:MAG TPA: hypothetical protein PKY82_21035 [Pyrinomonadaceae bacterium]|nr:hypothetical protein [Pyrinomonadaceae bacterium]
MKVKHLQGKESVVFCLINELNLRRDLIFLIFLLALPVFSQNYQAQSYSPQPNQNYLRNSQAFRQEIARFEITVTREGFAPLSLTQVPRINKGDVLKVKLLDEAVNGIKLDQSLYDWTLLVAFVNPNRKISTESKDSEQNSVSEEINFRKKGWYREHSFTVPYDSQPVFFLYPRPNYRSKILGLINKNYNEIKKLGEKTIDLAGAYAQIGMFLNELQGVLSGNGYNNNGYGSGYNSYSNYNQYNYGYGNNGYNATYNYNLLVSQSVERLARSFNIQLPNNCWQGGVGYSSGYNNYYGNNNQPGLSPEMVGRLQCVARNVRLEDFDFSVSRLLQQGGMLLAAQLQQKYPQLSYWISIAAFAVDFIVKVFKKTAMRIVPTIASSSDNPNNNGNGNYNSGYQQNYSNQGYNPNGSGQPQPVTKISLFAENQPDDSSFVTAYPIVLHKWQPEPDPEVISIRPPVLTESCLHQGVNLLKSTDLTEEQLTDNFTKDYTLTMSASNGFRKVFPLKKNLGLGGWELNITQQDLQEFPKIQMNLESVIKGTRGFNEIKSPPFFLPIAIGGSWQITTDSLAGFTVGERRTVTIKNTLGNCQCLQAVIYKPSFGGQFVFEADSYNKTASSSRQNVLQYSPDGKEVSFEVDAGNFQAGAGEVELRIFGGEAVKLPLKLYPLPPNITNLKIGKGDREGIISGDRLEQIQSVKINGRRAKIIGNQIQTTPNNSGNQPVYGNPPQTYGNQPGNQNPNQPNSGAQNAASPGSFTPNLQTNSPNERVIVFEDEKAKLTENATTLELSLEDNRILPVKQTFPVAPARPTIMANELKEVEGVAVKEKGERIKDEVVLQNSTVIVDSSKIKNQKGKAKDQNPALDLSKLPVFPIETDQISLNVQNASTDYDFKVENLSIETRLEKSGGNNPNNFNNFNPAYNTNSGQNLPLPKVLFEVMDWKNLRISLQISPELQKLLGGRRLQFRIRDRERGDSDWYSIRQTFVRMPEISSIACNNEMNGMCEMKGTTAYSV